MDQLAQEVLDFWMKAGPKKWFAKDDAFDEAIRTQFSKAHRDASRAAFAHWEGEPMGALALLLLLDQFPRNLFRETAHAFATDELALNIAKRALRNGYDGNCPEDMKQFFYMPLMHSEGLADQEYCLTLCLQSGKKDNVDYARIHRDIIARFGRFPHRNNVFGRETTAEEQAFLDEGGFAG